MTTRLHLIAKLDGDTVRLLSPEVGTFTGGPAQGCALSPGQVAGRLEQLGRTFVLVVPDDVTGRIQSTPFERVHHPVGCGDVIYELAPLSTGSTRASDAARAAGGARAGLALKATQSGRFYLRPAPGEPAFVAAGSIVEDGKPVGLIEVMKTFTHVVYRASGGLPARAKVVRVVATDGGDVRAGEVLLELESA